MNTNNRRKKKNGNVYINVAPLVDVMLVLMVIFMMTSQIATVGVQVDLPKTTAKTINEKDTPIIITIDKDANIFLEEANLTITELLEKLPMILQNGKSDVVYVKGDKDLNYGTLMKIMGILSSSGACKVSLIAELDNNSKVENTKKNDAANKAPGLKKKKK